MYSKLIIGLGDIAWRMIEQTTTQSLCAMSRTAPSNTGIDWCFLDLDQAPKQKIPPAETIFYLAPPQAQGIEDLRLRNFLAQLQTRPQRLVYISTSGVYGDCQGALVNERRAVNPQSARAKRRWDAEQSLQHWNKDTLCELVILRVSGIYGPGRWPIERIRQGISIIVPHEAPPSNRIHADDLARIILAAGERQLRHGVYNVADGSHSTMSDYYRQIARHFALPAPKQIALDAAQHELSPGMWSFVKESRRLDVSRLMEEFADCIHYPNLAATLAELTLD